ncbi:serine/threonine-protein kinase [Nannocystis sp.]|uniref:serine/threonine-protein kinase n=1 Tax=Nannocystis sp. TaxID=1962667 RepID=UPI002420694B|nr:serine/threonine-protein kinase [Nannocystis sp.]MBK7824152.1 serine/threonine protein kinase [Nannocystis sp.]MBK9755164.1 serine/threonine protein kinase [Nannocystis sp.]
MQSQATRPTLTWSRDDVLAAPGARVVGEPGTQVGDGRYEVLRLVGAGGMGQVYQAHDRVLERHVALKVMRPDVPAGERRRFRREALLGARLLHPSLVRVYDMGCGADGEAAWMAMEYLPGTDALRLLEGSRARGQALPWAALRRVLGQVLAALQYCHDCRVVHRDVKPANMFVTRDPNTRYLTTKLLDLGIALDLDGPDAVRVPGAKLEVLCGDPNYMAPEQTVAGAAVDARADLYAVGMSLYELCTGTLPFEDLVDAPLASLLAAQREADPGPPSARMASDTPPELAQRVDRLVARACAKRPSARFQSAADMIAALDAPLHEI